MTGPDRRRAGRGSWARRRLGLAAASDGRSGQATVELALLLPVVCGLLVLAIQVGLVIRSQVLLVQLARQVAREASLNGGTAPVDVAAAARVSGLDPGRVEVTVGPSSAGGIVTVTVRYRHPVAVPLVGVVRRDVVLGAQLAVRSEDAAPP